MRTRLPASGPVLLQGPQAAHALASQWTAQSRCSEMSSQGLPPCTGAITTERVLPWMPVSLLHADHVPHTDNSQSTNLGVGAGVGASVGADVGACVGHGSVSDRALQAAPPLIGATVTLRVRDCARAVPEHIDHAPQDDISQFTIQSISSNRTHLRPPFLGATVSTRVRIRLPADSPALMQGPQADQGPVWQCTSHSSTCSRSSGQLRPPLLSRTSTTLLR